MQPSWRLPGARRSNSRCLRTLLLFVVFCAAAFFGGWVCMYYYLSENRTESLEEPAELFVAPPAPTPQVEKDPDEVCYLHATGLGRHGNLMFEYAAAMCIASELDRTLIVSYRFNELLGSMFDLSAPDPGAFKKVNISSFKTVKQSPRCCSFDKKLLSLPRVDITLVGFFHSWLYFDKCQERIKAEFEFKESIVHQADDLLVKAARSFGWDRVKDSVLFVGIHVRRGERKSVNPLPHGDANADESYFKKAMSFYDGQYRDRNIVYIVVSDSSKTAGFVVQHPHAAVIDDKPVEVHMAVLSRCNHSIISVGALGWWTAFLAGGTVVYYNGWPDPTSSVSALYRLNQYFYPKWIGMS
ncbi:galactoside 2-alpha-L-fucosyltransferase 1 [Lingula anatina]|uniref:L-Fucosyltransferase n=1 Tax=Lingula anatina TaxID=7574 RepID=A0A1S3HXN6_LINAN|nr:galactoside 2-alpha-L-fucosyltransferase 1 [Lingula anatina]|eukprot:XP_013389834.1 galactoside 2-alpha-L-fucosyltransferase 1 [Lingula anatina]